MGSSLQKVFQGRGDQKGKGYWIVRTVPVFFLFIAWLLLFFAYAVSSPSYWFPVAVFAVAVSFGLHLWSARHSFSTEFLISLALLLSGIIDFSGAPPLKLAFFPFVIAMTRLYSWKPVVAVAVCIPFLGIRTGFDPASTTQLAPFAGALIVTAVTSALLYSRITREKEQALADLRRLTEDARGAVQGTGMESLDRGELVSHYVAMTQKTGQELQELLTTVKEAIAADAVHFFAHDRSEFALRSSTVDRGDVTITGGGVLDRVQREKKQFYSGEVRETNVDAGYVRKEKIGTLFAVPVTDGTILIGVLAADSIRYDAFNERDRKTLKEYFPRQLIRVLARERVDLVMNRILSGLRIIEEESQTLKTSLDIAEIARNICLSAGKVVRARAFFFLRQDDGAFQLKYLTDESIEPGRSYRFTGTIVNFAIENRHQQYAGDTRQWQKTAVLPFQTGPVRSFLAIPLLDKDRLLGLFVMLSEEADFLEPDQRRLLEVLCNHASATLASALLHAEIEKLATTDGLTGLFNHRRFQERLTEELKRLKRYNEPLSLILTDIDFFKKVNDTYGHPAGDQVLRGVAQLIREAIRDIDIPARYGGEEFAVILPGTTDEGARTIAERLRKAVMGATFSVDDKGLKVTISVGIASAPADATVKEDLIELTDKSLYHAKHNGRNQCVTWSSIR